MCPKKTKELPSKILLPGVGRQIEKHLARLNIHSIEDLLFHFPLRYQDRTFLNSLNQLTPGKEALVEGEVRLTLSPPRGRTKLLCEINDGSGKMYLRFFYLLPFQKSMLKIGARLRCFGEIKLGPKGLEMIHPEFQVIKESNLTLDTCLTPIYPLTEGISQYRIRKLIDQALALMDKDDRYDELIPATLLPSLSLPSFKEALKWIHHPPQTESLSALESFESIAHTRLIFEELLAHRVSLLQLKKRCQSALSIALNHEETYSQRFIKRLPFALTNAQKRVISEIKQDLNRPFPMLRLVQGDVGSGKTVIAVEAMLKAIQGGYQAALMAPTELLAEQHYRVIKEWLAPLDICVIFLSGQMKGCEKKAALDLVKAGTAQIIIGTHALFQKDVVFLNLALIVIDEQHRFGVNQRALFRQKGMKETFSPHQLMMTATPIPRTLAMSFYADLDCSSIDELPPGRKPVQTSVIANHKREQVIERIRRTCEEGKQVYWVCALIEDSELLACQSATQISMELQTLLPLFRIGLIHGRMTASEKEKVMLAFQLKEIHILVATTVIEVGVDVQNATVMIIENAERLGLSQLHQLRGRVGRGELASHCVLLYQSPLSQIAKMRLAVMRETTDGFQIAERDLELRGPGEVLGTRQTGEISLKIADLIRDKSYLPQVQQATDSMMKENHPSLDLLVDRWLGKGKEYGTV